MGRYASVLGIFIAGIIVVIAGVLLFLTGGSDPASFQTASIVTLIGLLVTGVGAIKGKRTMKSVGYFAAYPPDTYSRPAQSSAPIKMDRPPEQSQQPGSQAPQATQATPPQPERPTPTAPATGTPSPAAGTGAAKHSPAKVVRVLVCPKCGTENQETDTFCSNCGKKLRPKTLSGKKKK